MLIPDLISSWADFAMLSLGLGVALWAFLDTQGLFRFLCWWDRDRKFPKRRLQIVRWIAAFNAVASAWILLGHLLRQI